MKYSNFRDKTNRVIFSVERGLPVLDGRPKNQEHPTACRVLDLRRPHRSRLRRWSSSATSRRMPRRGDQVDRRKRLSRQERRHQRHLWCFLPGLWPLKGNWLLGCKDQRLTYDSWSCFQDRFNAQWSWDPLQIKRINHCVYYMNQVWFCILNHYFYAVLAIVSSDVI